MPESKRVRVIRVLEYDYPDQDTYERDMGRWVVPPNGVWRVRHATRAQTTIRSATTFSQTMPHQDEESDDRDQ
jgi:hypothetical protein